MKFSELPADPFDDNIVFEPREAEPAVAGLNAQPLRRLVEQFGLLEASQAAGGRPLRMKAQLVTSAEPGYGKSHLIGRLFKSLDCRAILVYLRPFQDAGSAWRSILLRVVQELTLPDAAAAERPARTQLDSLAIGVLSRLLVALREQGTLVGPDGGFWAERLRMDPWHTLGSGEDGRDFPSLAGWLQAEFRRDALPGAMDRAAREAGLTLHAPVRRWLEILAAYALSPRHGPKRAACLDWIRGDGAGDPDAELGGGRNESAWRRLQDLFAIASGYRPFLLCFDQTELFTGDASLAAAFGAVIECLVSHGSNQMTVVTTNLAPWRDNILPHIQTALRARFSTAIQLEGINAAQARALARRRLEAGGLDEEEIARFFAPPWFDDLFRESPTESVRRFLDLCSQRCRQLGAAASIPAPTLEERLRRCRAVLDHQPEALGFDPDVLQWAVGPEALGGALDGVAAERTDAGPCPVRWRRPAPAPEKRIYFGFEETSDGRVWRSILTFAKTGEAEEWKAGVRDRYVFLRSPEQETLPKPSWPALGPQFEEAVAGGLLTVRVLGRDELIALRAARDLFAQVAAGDAPFTREETLVFLRAQLADWWHSLLRTRDATPA